MIEVVVRTITVRNSPTGNLHTLLGIVIPDSGSMLFRTTEYREPQDFKVELTKIGKDAEALIYLDKLFSNTDIKDDLTIYLVNRGTIQLFEGTGYYWYITPEIAKAYAHLKERFNLKVCRYDRSIECCRYFPNSEIEGSVRGEFTKIELPSGKLARESAEKLNKEYEEFKKVRKLWNTYAKIRVKRNSRIYRIPNGYGLWCNCVGEYKDTPEDLQDIHLHQLDKFPEKNKILCKKCNKFHDVKSERYTCWKCGAPYQIYTPFDISGCNRCGASFVD